MLHMNHNEIARAIQAHSIDHTKRYSRLFTSNELEKLRHAAVMIPLFEHHDRWYVLLTQRSDTVDEHRGQVAYPGGAREAQDKDLQDTALREMQEEIGVDPEDVHVFGSLGDMPIITGYLVRPFVGHIPWPYPLQICNHEVESTFKVPLSWLADPGNHHVEYRSFAGREFPVILFKLYDGYQLWGASAEMTLALLSALNLIDS